MKAITLYQADDLSRFENEQDCLKYEQICLEVKEAIKLIGKKNKILDSRRDIRRVHSPKDVRTAFNNFMDICIKYIPIHKTSFNNVKKGVPFKYIDWMTVCLLLLITNHLKNGMSILGTNQNKKL